MILSCFFSIKMLVFLFLPEGKWSNHIKNEKITISSDLIECTLIRFPWVSEHFIIVHYLSTNKKGNYIVGYHNNTT